MCVSLELIFKDIVISIKKRHYENLIDGSKTFELRKSKPKESIRYMYPHISKSQVGITCALGVRKIHHDTVDNIWELVKNSCGISKKEYYKYYEKYKMAVAIEHDHTRHVLREPIKLINRAPQSWRYLSDTDKFLLKNNIVSNNFTCKLYVHKNELKLLDLSKIVNHKKFLNIKHLDDNIILNFIDCNNFKNSIMKR